MVIAKKAAMILAAAMLLCALMCGCGGGSELRFRAGNIVQRLLRIVQRGGEYGKAFFLKILCIKGASVLNVVRDLARRFPRLTGVVMGAGAGIAAGPPPE